MGPVTNGEFLDTYVSIARETDRQPGMAELALLNEVLSIDLNLQTLRSVSQTAARHINSASMRTAVLSELPMHQVMSRLYTTMAELEGAETVRQFTELSEALEWLGRGDFPAERLEKVPRP